MRSSAARQRKPGTRKRINNNVEDDEHELLSLPLHRAAAALQATSPGRRQDQSVKIRRRKLRRRWVGSRTFALVVASVLAGVIIVIVVADRSWVRYSLFSFPRYHRLKLVNPAVPIESAKIAIVTIHKGWKYHGSLGTFLVNNKESYANLHGYAYADAVPDEKYLMPLEQPGMRLHNRPVYYEKPRFLLHLMEQNIRLEWLLWIDGDAIITQPYVSVEERIEEFEKLHRATGSSGKRQLNDLCLAWAEDTMPNAGVLLIRNNPMSRELFRKALDTWVESDTFNSFTDQASLTAAIDRNITYQGCSLLLSEHRSVLLQSRVRGAANGLWKSGHWVLHLPNHNYLELLGSLRRVGRTLRRDPPPLIPPLERPSIESLSTTRKDRFTKVQNAIRHAWGGYSRTCLQPSSSTTRHKVLGSHIPCDDLSPIAGVGHDWLYHAATLHDSLDTLAIAFGTESDEYREGLNAILRQDIQATSLRPTKTFEYSLRVVGGLLGAFSVTGDVRLLARAKDAVDSLLQSPFASSPTNLPRMFDVLFPSRGGSLFHTAYSKLYDWGRDTFTNEHHFNSLAGIGSFSLEFHYLSQILGGDEKYKSSADKIFRHVAHYQAPDGTIPSQWNVMTGEPIHLNGGLGSGSDSFVEYLLKVPLLYCTANSAFSPCVQDHPVVQEMFALYETMMENALPKHIVWRKRPNDTIAFPTDNMRYHQLLCFLPGMLALGASAKASASGTNELTLAEQLIEGCHEMYNHSATGLGPEEALFDKETNAVLPKTSNPSFLLRPEYIESIFVLYRLTGNEHYQDLGWKVFESLDRYCKIKSGYAGLKSVTDPDAGFVDDMPSYFLAETLKYLLLLFASDDFISLDDFVLTTEAHPLRRRLHGNDIRKYGNYIKEELSDNAYAIPAPDQFSAYTLVVFVACAVFGIIACTKGRGCCLWRKSTFSVRGKAT